MSSLNDDEPIYSNKPTCSSSSLRDDDDGDDEVVLRKKKTTTTNVRGKRKTPSSAKALISASDDSDNKTKKTPARKVKQNLEKDKTNIDEAVLSKLKSPEISVPEPEYVSPSSSTNNNSQYSLNDDDEDNNTHSSAKSTQKMIDFQSNDNDMSKSLLDKITADDYKYHSFNPESFIEIKWKVYQQIKENFPDISMFLQQPGNTFIIGKTNLSELIKLKSQPLKNFTQHIIVFNFSPEPIILGVNKSDFDEYSSQKLNAYIIKNSYESLTVKNVFMVIVTYKKKYAKILFEKYLLCDKIKSRMLKSRGLWNNHNNPSKVK